jgi:iron(III) transport system permease protein
VSLGKLRWVARLVVIVYIFCASVLPFAALVFASLQPFWTAHINWNVLGFANWSTAFSGAGSRAAIGNSVLLGVIAGTIVVMVSGILAVYGLVTRPGIERSIGLLTKLPAGMSGVIVALGILIAFGGKPIALDGTIWILLVAYVVSHMPNASIAAEASARQVGSELIDASRMCGATLGDAFRSVMLPLMAPGLAAAWALVFALIVGDLTSAAVLSGPNNPVIGYQILEIYQEGTYSQLAVLGVIIAVISSVAVGLVLRFGRPRLVSRRTTP